MDINVTRTWFTNQSTISQVTIDGKAVCKLLEDTDRGLEKTWTLSEIEAKKVYGKTAIPLGKYEVAISFSNHFQKLLPILLQVPGYEGIRIHPGNTEVDSLGCLLPGVEKGDNAVSQSRVAFADLFVRIQKAIKTEKVYVNITREPKAWKAFYKP